MVEFEFLSPTDRPALLALSSPELQNAALLTLSELGFKVHSTETHEQFLSRFAQVQYQVVLIEEAFACASIAENGALGTLQNMPMMNRRHSTIILVGPSFQSLHPMQAFQQSVHAVVNPDEIANLAQIVQKVTADNDLFLNAYRETMMRLAQGKS